MTCRAKLRTVSLAALVVATLFLPEIAISEEQPPAPVAESVFDLKTLEARGWLRDDYYAVRAGEVKVGFIRRAFSATEFDGEPAVAREFEAHIDVAGDGNGAVTRTRTVFLLAPPQPLVFARAETTESGRTSSRQATRHGDRMDIVTQVRGVRTEGAAVLPGVTLADELSVERLVWDASHRKGGGVGATLDAMGFDLNSLAIGRRRVTVTAVRAAAVGADVGADVGATSSEFDVEVKIKAHLIETVVADDKGCVLSGPLGGGLRYQRAERERAIDPVDRRSLELLSRVSMIVAPAPESLGAPPSAEALPPREVGATLGDVRLLRKMTVSADHSIAASILRTPWQRAQRVDDRIVIEVTRDADGAVATDAQRDLALAPDEGLDIDAPEIRATAQRLLVGTSSRAVQADVLCRYVSETVADEIVIGTLSALDVLRGKRGDCTEHVQLFLALCRTVGIPARPVEGLVWMGDDVHAFGWHRWAEIVLDGRWRTVDPTFARMPADAARLVVDGAPASRTRLWGAKLTLIAVDRADPPKDDQKK